MRRLLLIPLLIGSALHAQARAGAAAPAPAATLTGMVYDSLVGAPLAGATVIVSGSTITANTDATGRYVMNVDSVGEGRRTLSFFHPSLDSIGIAAPPRTIVLKRGVSEVADLAVPSAATIVAAFCPPGDAAASRTLIMGDVRDAEADRPLAGAFVVVQWSAMSVGNSTIARLPQALSVRADSDGHFRLCGVPAQTPLRAQARLAPKTSGFIDLELAPNGVVIQEFLVGERPTPAAAAAAPGAPGAPAAPGPATAAAAPLGKSVLTGSVVGADGAPLEGAQVFLVGTPRSARADYKGTFRLAGLPAGTQTVEVRLLSYQPRRYTVNLTPTKEARLSAILDTRAQVLDPIIVTGKSTSDIPGFDERKARGAGSFFTQKEISDRTTNAISTLFRQVAGMTVLFVDGEYVIVSTRAATNCKNVQYIVDGTRYDLAGTDIDDAFRPNEIEAIEVYNTATDTPVQWQGGQAACGTVVIWTVRGHFKKKQAPATTTPP